jgi:hypothetical protein
MTRPQVHDRLAIDDDRDCLPECALLQELVGQQVAHEGIPGVAVPAQLGNHRVLPPSSRSHEGVDTRLPRRLPFLSQRRCSGSAPLRTVSAYRTQWCSTLGDARVKMHVG